MKQTIIKGNIRNHLPTSLLMPVDKGKFLWALREQDAILDHAENLVLMCDMRHTKIPKELQGLFIEHMISVAETVKAMEDAVEKHKRFWLKSGFVKKNGSRPNNLSIKSMRQSITQIRRNTT
jgi:uncharacterized protein Yka (UPF0111/DUF47 family)